MTLKNLVSSKLQRTDEMSKTLLSGSNLPTAGRNLLLCTRLNGIASENDNICNQHCENIKSELLLENSWIRFPFWTSVI
jgi:hypothetical protein